MVKPKKIRHVMYPPGTFYFKPYGQKGPAMNNIILSIDEYEAIRLADYKKLKQEEAAEKMGISRPTFTRLIENARRKVAEAIVNGNGIKIEGGNFIFIKNRIRCRSCGSMWETEEKASDIYKPCPRCNSLLVENLGEKYKKNTLEVRHRRGGWH